MSVAVHFDMSAPRVAQYMSRMPHTIEASEPLEKAHELMREYQIRHLPVLRDGELVGIVTLGDLHLLETLKDVNLKVEVADAMTEKPFTVAPDDRLDQVAALMADKRVSSVVVMENSEIQGIFTNIDALTTLLHLWKRAP